MCSSDLIMGPLPESIKGNKYILVFMDYLTKFPEAFALPDQTTEAFALPDQTTEAIAKIYVNEIVTRYGPPRKLLSDRGTNFRSDWDIYLPSMLFAYRMCTHSTTGQSPYFLMYGREPNMPIDLDYLPTISQYMELSDYATDLAEKMQRIWQRSNTVKNSTKKLMIRKQKNINSK